MHYQQLIVIAALASTALSNTLVFEKRQNSVCDQQRLTCGAAPGANQSLCASKKSYCDACESAYESYITSPNSNKAFAASLRNECFAASAAGDGSGVVPIISTFSAAQVGTPSTTSSTPVSTSTAPPAASTTPTTQCDQQRLECGAAPGANQSLCAVQKNTCDACEAAYESYVTSPGSNKSLAGALRAECFAASKVGTGEGALPIISSLSAAQAGGSSATPTIAPPTPSFTTVTTTLIHPSGSVVVPPPSGVPTGAPGGGVTGIPSGPSGVIPSGSPSSTRTNATFTSTFPTTAPQFTGAAVANQPMGALGVLLLGMAFVL